MDAIWDVTRFRRFSRNHIGGFSKSQIQFGIGIGYRYYILTINQLMVKFLSWQISLKSTLSLSLSLSLFSKINIKINVYVYIYIYIYICTVSDTDTELDLGFRGYPYVISEKSPKSDHVPPNLFLQNLFLRNLTTRMYNEHLVQHVWYVTVLNGSRLS